MKYADSLNKPASPEDFVFYSTDKKGHHATLPKTAIPPEMDQLLNEALAQTRFPYRTKADIVRDALYHRLKWLDDNQNMGHGDLLQRVKAIDAIVQQEDSSAKYLEQMRAMDTVIGRTSDSPNYQRQIVNSFADQIYAMPQGYWRDRYLKFLQERYGHLLDRRPVSLKPGTFADDEKEEE